MANLRGVVALRQLLDDRDKGGGTREELYEAPGDILGSDPMDIEGGLHDKVCTDRIEIAHGGSLTSCFKEDSMLDTMCKMSLQ